MSSDLIQSMDTFPVRADVDGELHAEIRLTNHRRIFLKRAYQKDDHGNAHICCVLSGIQFLT